MRQVSNNGWGSIHLSVPLIALSGVGCDIVVIHPGRVHRWTVTICLQYDTLSICCLLVSDYRGTRRASKVCCQSLHVVTSAAL